MKVKLAYSIVYEDNSLESGIESFNTKVAAQQFDKFLKRTHDEVQSVIIYDEPDYESLKWEGSIPKYKQGKIKEI